MYVPALPKSNPQLPSWRRRRGQSMPVSLRYLDHWSRWCVWSCQPAPAAHRPITNTLHWSNDVCVWSCQLAPAAHRPITNPGAIYKLMQQDVTTIVRHRALRTVHWVASIVEQHESYWTVINTWLMKWKLSTFILLHAIRINFDLCTVS